MVVAILNESLDVFRHQGRLFVNNSMPAVWNAYQLAARHPALEPIEAIGKRETFLFADNQERWSEHILP